MNDIQKPMDTSMAARKLFYAGKTLTGEPIAPVELYVPADSYLGRVWTVERHARMLGLGLFFTGGIGLCFYSTGMLSLMFAFVSGSGLGILAAKTFLDKRSKCYETR